MKIDLTGKTALITGSTAGIGYGIAAGLAATGARVLVNGRNADKVADAVAGITRAGGKAAAAPGDVSTAEGCAALVKANPDVDILVNNAGIFEPKPFLDIPDADWMNIFEVNVMSGIRLSRAYLPGMLKRDWGRIVFISSESGLQIPVEMVHYGMTKTAQLSVARGLAESTGGSGVTVNSVLPGPTMSDGVEAFIQQMAEKSGVSKDEMARSFVKEHRPSSLLQRFATVEEVANMVVYICSKQASATNGAALRVEGGVVRSIV